MSMKFHRKCQVSRQRLSYVILVHHPFNKVWPGNHRVSVVQTQIQICSYTITHFSFEIVFLIYIRFLHENPYKTDRLPNTCMPFCRTLPNQQQFRGTRTFSPLPIERKYNGFPNGHLSSEANRRPSPV